MKTFSIAHPSEGFITYQDRKRYLWLLSIVMPAVPLLSLLVFLQTGLEWVLALPMLFIYLVIPLLDSIIGSDTNNPPEAIVPQLESDTYYRYLTFATVPMHFIVLITAAYIVGSNDLNWWAIVMMAVVAGGYNGFSINTAHELGHKQTSVERYLAKMCMAVTAYGHFCIDHNRGHHVSVATPEDPASSRMGESIYAFALREIPGNFIRGWQLETIRLQKQGKNLISIHNEILQSYFLSAVLQGTIIYVFGWILLPFLIIHNAWAWFQLTSANYVEHYGLLRQRKDNGRYEPCQPHHSWNANYILTNVMLYNLERHSDHHTNPVRRYQSLRNFEDIPEMPNGYFGMYVLAYIPYLWFLVMDKRLLALPHIQGDLSKVNINPKNRAAIYARYGQ